VSSASTYWGLASYGETSVRPWLEGLVPEMSEGGGSGAVDSDSKLGMGVGHHWD
jgi:hypothetical protein